MAIGLAIPLPAISGAEPCTGSYSALRFWVFGLTSPSEADASMPSEPVSIAAMSDSMSPNRLSVTTTSNCFGFLTSCMPPESASWCSNCTSLNSRACRSVITSFQSTPVFMTLRFSIEVTLLRRWRASSNATRPNALDLVGVVDLRIDGALLAVAEVGDGLRLAEIHAAGQLAQDHDVEALDQLALERGGIRQRRIGHRGAQVGIEAEVLAQAQQAGFRAHLVGHLVPLRAADGTEDHRVRRLGLGHGCIGDRRPCARRSRRRRPALRRRKTAPIPFLLNRSISVLTSAMTSGPMPSPGSRRSL